jgi:hypothetical protein
MIISAEAAFIAVGGILISVLLILLARWDADRVIERLLKEDEIEFLKKIRDGYIIVKKNDSEQEKERPL